MRVYVTLEKEAINKIRIFIYSPRQQDQKTMTLNITVMVVTVGVHAHILMPKMLSRMIFSDHLLLWCISYHF